MSSSIPGPRALPTSRHDLSTYWGRVKHSMDICDPRTLFISSATLSSQMELLRRYKIGEIPTMTPELWHAKKVVDATVHPDTGDKVLLPFRMSCFVFSNLIVTAGMLTPNLTTRGTLAWQIANQSLNVAINASNANKSTPLSYQQMGISYLLAVGSSCGVALGLNSLVPRLKKLSPTTRTILGRLVPFAAVVTAGVVNVAVMRGGELLEGIDVFPLATFALSAGEKSKDEKDVGSSSLGKSHKAAYTGVSQTAISRVLNASPIMVLPPLVLYKLQQSWGLLKKRPALVTPVNLGLIFVTSVFALPLALGAFPQRVIWPAEKLEEGLKREAERRGVKEVEFNRGI